MIHASIPELITRVKIDFAVIDEVATKCPAQKRMSKPQGLKIGRDGSKKHQEVVNNEMEIVVGQQKTGIQDKTRYRELNLCP